MGPALGVDLGASNLRALVGDADGGALGRHRIETPRTGDDEDVIRAVLDVGSEACRRAGLDPADVAAVGIATIGPLDPDDGAVVDPVNLPGVERLALVDPVARRFDAAVRLHNDATAAAIGERFAADGDPADLVYLTLSTGIGAGVLADGRVLVGHRGNAGEVGHVTLDPDSALECGCGSVGHWEALCSGENLPAHARAIAAEGVPTDLDLAAADAEKLLSAAGRDPVATRLAERIGRWNAVGVATLVQAYDPERVVVGGAVARNHPETVLGPIRASLPERCLTSPPPVELTRLGDETTVRGALASALTGGTGGRSDLPPPDHNG